MCRLTDRTTERTQNNSTNEFQVQIPADTTDLNTLNPRLRRWVPSVLLGRGYIVLSL